MTECRNTVGGSRDTVCIDTYRVLDSCRDKDCFEDVRVYLTGEGQDIIDRTCAVRAKSAEVVSANIDIDSVPFNRGFYQLYLRLYTKITCEACVGPGCLKEFEGIATVEKNVILFGGEGNVSVFRSELQHSSFCSCGGKCVKKGTSLPLAVLETVDPIVLGTKIVEPGMPCRTSTVVSVDEIPAGVFSGMCSELVDCQGSNRLLVSLGLFSVIRIERPAQYLVSGVEYSVPEKECVMPPVEDPCSLFRQMAFPTGEFMSQPGCGCRMNDGEKKCGCHKED